MNQRSVLKRALILAVPIMIQNGITNAVGLVDHIMVGSLGTEAMTAVSIVGQLLFVYSLALFGGISGPGIYTAQFYGQGNTEGVRASTRMKAMIAIGCTVIGIGVLIFAREPLLNLYMHGESAEIDASLTLNHARDYLHIMLLGLPAMAITQIYSGTLRETGDSVKPMAAGIVSVAADVVFNYLFIYGNLGFPQLGVRGAAIATVIARYLEMTVLIVWVYARRSRHPFVSGLWRTLKIPRELCIRMIRKTIPIFCNEFLWAAAIAALTQCYSTRGLEVVAGINISNALSNLLSVVFVALGSAVGILVGQTLGTGEFDRAKREALILIRFSALICIGLSVILLALSHVFPQIYDTTDEVRSLATHFIIITALCLPMHGLLNSLYFTLRCGGKTLITFIFDSVFSWSATLPLALVLCFLTDWHILLVYLLVQLADIIKIIIGALMIRKGIWINNLAEEFKTSGTT